MPFWQMCAPMPIASRSSLTAVQLVHHMDSFTVDKHNDGAESCRYGIIFSGHWVALSELVKVEGQRTLRTTELLKASGKESQVSLVAVLIGMLLPPSVVPYQPHDRETVPWKFANVCIRRRGGAEGGGGGGHTPSKRKLDDRANDEESAGESKRTRQTGGGDAPSVSAAVESAAARGASVILEFADEGPRSGHLVDLENALTLISGLENPHEPEPARITTHYRQGTGKQPPLTIGCAENLQSQNADTVWRGSWPMHNGASPSVIVKMFEAALFRELRAELTARTRVRTVLGTKVVSCLAVLASPSLDWMAMVMEDAGPTVEALGGWASTGGEQRLPLFKAVTRMHELGIDHGDLAARNVAKRTSGELCVLDFGEANTEHICLGFGRCPELVKLQMELEVA
ncbi:hypothetical protein C8R44DRAFT_116187 [Mycena epipterygia]|nr:hypothetical protein C8R44DRAFT_116187 [Mycena epipterygia]